MKIELIVSNACNVVLDDGTSFYLNDNGSGSLSINLTNKNKSKSKLSVKTLNYIPNDKKLPFDYTAIDNQGTILLSEDK
jgi:hypothetical protein